MERQEIESMVAEVIKTTIDDIFPDYYEYSSDWEVLVAKFGVDSDPEPFELYEGDGVIVLHLPDAGRVGIRDNAQVFWADDNIGFEVQNA